jgi:hypothetical protein
MILTPLEYANKFPLNGKVVCSETIKNRCRNNQLPTNHIPHKLSGGWVIEIQELPEEWKNFDVILKPKR